MAQFYLQLPDSLAHKVRQRAAAHHMSVSRYLAMVVSREVDSGVPDGYWDRVISGWQGELERPTQGEYERRDELDDVPG